MTFTITAHGLLHVIGCLFFIVVSFFLGAGGMLSGMDAEGRGGNATLPMILGAMACLVLSVGVWWL